MASSVRLDEFSEDISKMADLRIDFGGIFGSRERGPKNWNLLSCGRNKMLTLWNWKSGDRIGDVCDAHDGMILSIIEYKKDRYATGSCDNSIRLWHGYEQNEFEYEGQLLGHKQDVNCLCSLGDGLIVSGSDDHTLRVWDVDKMECVRQFKRHLNDIRDVVTVDKNQVASCSYDKTVRVFDCEKGKQKNVLRKHISRVRCLEVVRDRELLFSGSYGRRCIMWDLHTKKHVHMIKENNWINSLHYFNPKQLLITGDDQGKVGFWDIRKTRRALKHCQIHENFVTCIVTISKDMIENDVNQIGTCSTDGTICIVDVQKYRIVNKMEEQSWIFSILNHERSSPNKELMYEDLKERVEFMHDKLGEFVLIVRKKGRFDSFERIRLVKMFMV